MKKEPLGQSLAKLILAVSLIISIGALLGSIGYLVTRQRAVVVPEIKNELNEIEISVDGRSILNFETQEVIFTINDTQKYLEVSGYKYDPETFQTTNAKYEGDCFIDAALSNNKDRVVFSSGCLSGDLPQAWIGIHNLNWESDPSTNCANQNCLGIPKFKFLDGGSGRDFVWSQSDKTITYEADLGLSGMTEIRTIDSQTGIILEKKNKTVQELNDSTTIWKTYKNEKYGFELQYPAFGGEYDFAYDANENSVKSKFLTIYIVDKKDLTISDKRGNLKYNPVTDKWIDLDSGIEDCMPTQNLGLDSIPAYHYGNQMPSNYPREDIIITNKDFAFRIYRESYDYTLETVELQEKIMGTFRILGDTIYIKSECN